MSGQIKVPDGAFLLASAARHDSVTGDAVRGWRGVRGMVFILDFTSGATFGDTLDVTIQTSLDGTVWIPIHRFTQIDAGTASGFRVITISRGDLVGVGVLAQFLTSADVVTRPIFGPYYRAVATLNIAAEAETFTFSVYAAPMAAGMTAGQMAA